MKGHKKRCQCVGCKALRKRGRKRKAKAKPAKKRRAKASGSPPTVIYLVED